MEDILGVDLATDRGGVPLPPDGVHPASLRGRDLEGCFDLLRRARAATYQVITTWHDETLDTTVQFGPMTVSHRWVLYHVLEHFAAHYGQILHLLHCMKDHQVSLPERRGMF